MVRQHLETLLIFKCLLFLELTNCLQSSIFRVAGGVVKATSGGIDLTPDPKFPQGQERGIRTL